MGIPNLNTGTGWARPGGERPARGPYEAWKSSGVPCHGVRGLVKCLTQRSGKVFISVQQVTLS